MKTIIESIINSMTTPPSFIYSKLTQANVMWDDANFPNALLLEFLSGRLNSAGNTTFPTYNITLFFGDLVDLDHSPDDNLTVIEAMLTLAIEFTNLMNLSGLVDVLTEVNWSAFYDRGDVNVAGVQLEFSCRKKYGTAIC